MGHVLMIHAVKDYEAWKAIFDAAAGIRKWPERKVIPF